MKLKWEKKEEPVESYKIENDKYHVDLSFFCVRDIITEEEKQDYMDILRIGAERNDYDMINQGLVKYQKYKENKYLHHGQGIYSIDYFGFWLAVLPNKDLGL